jgi:hypothetical protein
MFGLAALYFYPARYPALSLAFAVVWVAWWLFTGGFGICAAVVSAGSVSLGARAWPSAFRPWSPRQRPDAPEGVRASIAGETAHVGGEGRR